MSAPFDATNVPDHAGVLASRASDGSSARFVVGEPAVGRPSPMRLTVILPHGGGGGNHFLPWTWPRDIQGRPSHHRDGLVLREDP
jgi:hypothetical protein